jgi:hypothetical protein
LRASYSLVTAKRQLLSCYDNGDEIMEYKINHEEDIFDWISIFQMISIELFDTFSDELKFPTVVSKDLRAIATQFWLALHAYMAISTPDFTPPKLPNAPLFSPLSDIDPYVQIWDNIFAQLTHLGYGDTIYSWGQKTIKYQNLIDKLYILTADWNIALRDWVRDPEDDRAIPMPLTLPPEIDEKLRVHVKKYDNDIKELNSWPAPVHLNLTEKKTYNECSDILLRHVRYHRMTIMWKNIFALLSQTELKTLEQWGVGMFEIWSFKDPDPASLTEIYSHINNIPSMS